MRPGANAGIKLPATDPAASRRDRIWSGGFIVYLGELQCGLARVAGISSVETDESWFMACFNVARRNSPGSAYAKSAPRSFRASSFNVALARIAGDPTPDCRRCASPSLQCGPARLTGISGVTEQMPSGARRRFNAARRESPGISGHAVQVSNGHRAVASMWPEAALRLFGLPRHHR